jgi:hypothetical protein
MIMAIPESQLESWSHQGAMKMSRDTYGSIKTSLEANAATYANKEFEIYLQGSYGNDTNIRGDSDVDVVIQLNSTFHRNLDRLPPDQVQAYQQAYSNATYTFADFKRDIVEHLKGKYGHQQVAVGKKSVKLRSASDRLGADVAVCCQYRDYHWFKSLRDQRYDEGIYFKSTDGQEIINYPKYHSKNCTTKHQDTGNRFKPMVRIVKNMRGYLVEKSVIENDLASSYFIEGLLYNVSNNQFSGDFGSIFCTCINWLLKADRSQFVCPSRKHWLFGESAVQWKADKCTQFLNALVDFWNGW